MPAFGVLPVHAVYKGNSYQLINSADATAGNVTTTQPVAVGPEPGSGARTVVIHNITNQQATMEYSPDNVQTYEELSGAIVPAGSALAYNLSGGFILATFVTAPSSGLLTIAG